MQRKRDTFHRANVVNPTAFGRGTRAMADQRAEVKRSRVRLCCEPCGKRLVHPFSSTDDVALAYRPDPERSAFIGGELVTMPSRPWRCRRGHSCSVTLTRMLAEYTAAIERGDRTIRLPLGRVP